MKNVLLPSVITLFLTKFLGVIIDDKLNWSDHILYVKNKISKSIGIIHKTHNFLD